MKVLIEPTRGHYSDPRHAEYRKKLDVIFFDDTGSTRIEYALERLIGQSPAPHTSPIYRASSRLSYHLIPYLKRAYTQPSSGYRQWEDHLLHTIATQAMWKATIVGILEAGKEPEKPQYREPTIKESYVFGIVASAIDILDKQGEEERETCQRISLDSTSRLNAHKTRQVNSLLYEIQKSRHKVQGFLTSLLNPPLGVRG